MGAREDVFDCEVFFVTVEAVWGKRVFGLIIKE